MTDSLAILPVEMFNMTHAHLWLKLGHHQSRVRSAEAKAVAQSNINRVLPRLKQLQQSRHGSVTGARVRNGRTNVARHGQSRDERLYGT